MKIGALITARMGSSRLSDKHLRLIDGRPALTYLLDRIECEFNAEIGDGRVVPLLTTGNPQRNGALAALCAGRSTQVFHGDDENVPRRHLQAAQAFGLDAILAIDGDDLFCVPEAMRAVYSLLYRRAPLAKSTGLPLGMNSWGYSRQALETALRHVDMVVLETGWGRIFDAIPAQQQEFPCTDADSVRATLDYDADLAFFARAICEVPGWAGLAAADFVGALIDRGIHRENANLNEQYWNNFSSGIAMENCKDSA